MTWATSTDRSYSDLTDDQKAYVDRFFLAGNPEAYNYRIDEQGRVLTRIRKS